MLTGPLVMAALEIGGKVALSYGLASSFRPRKYYTIPKETIEAVLEDLEQLFDFALIEFQRVLFVENIVHTLPVSSPATFLERNRCLIEGSLSSRPLPPTG